MGALRLEAEGWLMNANGAPSRAPPHQFKQSEGPGE
jgi:hypothetical protein